MKDYIVSARKYRPVSFATVVGQEALTSTLRNTVKSGKLAHAYLFCGPRGVGKTTCARIFAKAINCEHPTAEGEACELCESCKAFEEGRSLNVFELDAASNNSVNDIKSLMEQTRIPPQVGRYKVFIIDEVHMLSQAAFNAFLKTLEEPPAHVIFILATTEKHQILPTILSRCQIYDFERMSIPNIMEQLKRVAEQEGVTYEAEALNVIAEKADGGMRDALSIFDQVASFSQGHITFEKTIEDLNVLDSENYFRTIDLALENKVADIMLLLNGILQKGFEAGNFVNGLAMHIRNVLVAKDAATIQLLEVSERQKQRFEEQAKRCPTRFLYQALQLATQCDREYKRSSNKRLLAELTLIEIAQITQPDDEKPGAGRSPKQLKSLFRHILLSAQPKKVQQVTITERPSHPKPSTEDAKQETTPAISVQTTQASSATHSFSLKGANLKLGGFGTSFNALLNKEEKKKADENNIEVTNKDEDAQFTEADLLLHWRAMCNRMPDSMYGMAQRMKNMKPVITTYPNVEVVAENKILYEQMTSIVKRIRATLAKDLHNGQINILIRLAKQEEIKPMLSPSQALEKLIKENQAVSKLVKTLGLDLV